MWGTDAHGLIWRVDALAAGVTENALRQAQREGLIHPVGRGVFAPATLYPPDAGDARREHYRLRSLAAAAAITRSTDGDRRAISHESAAAVLGLELLLPNTTRVHVTNGRCSGGNVTATRSMHPGLLHDDDVVMIDGLPVTSPGRTAVDVALELTDFARILAAFDSALRCGVRRSELERRLTAPRRGVARARHVLGFANGLSANPGESWSRAQILEAGLPVPLLQAEYRLGDGSLAICDYDWDGIVVGEFDGFGKYLRDGLRPGEDVADVVIREKIRQDALWDLGLHVVRWHWEHLRKGRFIAHLTQNLRRFGVSV
ncbi:MAG: hypothetical protein WBA05_04250 [Gordonia sp. (in: high G+C Gram-positive bacteria)]|uniref:hypothetical protein n=1 Tax=Gordonia sp. (in: high G+C Gram-positive bacteria) TaxID=84139 RepID=UPI003C7071EA